MVYLNTRSKEWIRAALLKPWFTKQPNEQDWADYTEAMTIELARLKPDVRSVKDAHAIKGIHDPDNRQDYAEYLKGGAAHKGKLGSDEVDKSQDQTND